MIKLKGLLNEAKLPQPKDGNIDVEEYVYEFQKYVIEKLPKLNGWESDMDYHSGAIEWFKKGGNDELLIYATPMWENEPYVPVDVNLEGDSIFFKKIKFIPTYDMKQDLKQYKKIMIDTLKLINTKVKT